MPRTVVLISILFFPAVGLAQKAAVLPVVHRVADTGVESPEAAEPIWEAAIGGVEDAGMALVDPAEVARIISELPVDPNRGCKDKACVQQVAQRLGADQALFVSVTEVSDMEHEIEIVLANGEDVEERRNDGLYVVASEVRRLVALALQKTPEDEPEPEPAIPPEPARDKPWRPTPTLFWISAGVTGALAVTTGIMEAVVYSRYMELDADKKDMGYWDTTRNLQIAERVLFVGTLVGLAATGALFYFTDFDKEKTGRDTASWSLSPSIGPDRGALILTGRF